MRKEARRESQKVSPKEKIPPKGSPKVRTIRVKEKVLAKIPQNVLQPRMINVCIAASMVTLKGTVGS